MQANNAGRNFGMLLLPFVFSILNFLFAYVQPNEISTAYILSIEISKRPIQFISDCY